MGIRSFVGIRLMMHVADNNIRSMLVAMVVGAIVLCTPLYAGRLLFYHNEGEA